jgi:hypothetical protein
LKDSPSCLADCFTWPQVALTHHVLSRTIETSNAHAVNSTVMEQYQQRVVFF